MTREGLERVVREQIAQVEGIILGAKGRDYDGELDVLDTFKLIADDVGITPMQVWGVLFNKHRRAINRYLRHGQVESEPIDGRIDDAIGYLILLKALTVDGDPTAK